MLLTFTLINNDHPVSIKASSIQAVSCHTFNAYRIDNPETNTQITLSNETFIVKDEYEEVMKQWRNYLDYKHDNF